MTEWWMAHQRFKTQMCCDVKCERGYLCPYAHNILECYIGIARVKQLTGRAIDSPEYERRRLNARRIYAATERFSLFDQQPEQYLMGKK